tara:strand:- start:2056 stop:3330 length:1275 start_codon:yes stop_codon:yes gene_type:complete
MATRKPTAKTAPRKPKKPARKPKKIARKKPARKTTKIARKKPARKPTKAGKDRANYKKHPKKIKLYSGQTIPNPDAGCGPDMFLMSGKCRRKFDEEVLKILCPRVRLAKGSLNPARMDKIMDDAGLKGTPFTDAEIRKLDEHCAKMHEELVDDMQSLGAQEAYIFGAIKDLFTRMPMLMGKQVFDQLFGVIGYKTSRIAPGYVEVKKRVKSATGRLSSVVKQIPFGAIGAGLSRVAKAAGSAAYAAGNFMAEQGFRAAKWVINNPTAQRLFMHLSKLVKHAICTAMGQLKERNNMTWKELAGEKFSVYKTDLFQLVGAQAPAIGAAVTGALVAATGGVGAIATPAVGMALTGISTMVLQTVSTAGRLEDFISTLTSGCSQFEYALDKQAFKLRIMDMGIGTYGPMLFRLLEGIDLSQLNRLLGV